MKDFVKDYTDWLNDNMTQYKISENLFEITTPFLDRHNDYTQIYINYISDNEIEVNDYGYTLDDLRMSGFEFNTDKRRQLLNQVVNRLGVGIRDDIIYSKVNSVDKLAETKHKVLQAMIYINDMFVLNRSNVQNLFYQDVKEFFDKHSIYYTENISMIGKSKLNHNFDYVLQRNNANPERVIKLMNHPDRKENYSSIMFSWTDTLPVRREDTKLIVLLNDNNKVSNDVLEGFRNYSNEGVLPILWNDIGNNIEKLA